nr:ABC transporter ATP-binding protein [Halieaceae bacterium]
SAQHVTDALYMTDKATENYIREHERHFRHHFSQTLMFLFIWAAASASLLGLGGWLVIQGQLSLGQLVAAELVLSVVFAGIAQLGTYLTYFYDLCAAVEELSLFHDIEQDPPTLTPRPTGQGASIAFANAVGESRGTRLTLDFTIPAGSRVFAASHNHAAQRVFTSFMKRHEHPDSGYIALGGQDFDSFQAHHLRQDIIVLDRPRIVESSLREYLEFSMGAEQEDDLLAVLETVGLDSVVAQLGDGLDTRLAATGWPLSTLETMQLKLASALVAHPRVLVLSQIYDMMPDEYMLASFERLQQSDRTTIIYFSNKHTDLNFDQFLYLGEDQQRLYDGYHQLCDAAGLPRRALEPVAGRPKIVQAS